MSRPRRWTDEQLTDAVAGSCSWGEVVRKLGLAKSRATYGTVRGHATRLQLHVDHLPAVGETIAIFSCEPLPLPPAEAQPSARTRVARKGWGA